MSVTAKAQTEQLRKVLKQSTNKQGEGNLEDHLQKLFNFLILHYPNQALEKFEEASYLIKNGKDISKFLKVSDDRDYRDLFESLQEYTTQMQKKFAKPQPNEDGEMPEEPAPVNYVSDLLKDAKMWQWAGIGFGEQEVYRLQKSIKQLAETSQATDIKFYGKILGTQADYYIVEVANTPDEEGGEEVDPEMEQNIGVNKYAYYVATNSLSGWTKLPNLTPKQVVAARKVRVLFTGDLERQIFTNPFFDGQEKHLLRAQISRITHATRLVPRGIWKVTEAEEEGGETREIEQIERGDDEPGPSFATHALKDMKCWQHLEPAILKCGKTIHQEPSEAEGLEEE
jgi:radial spoke head protein 4/6